MDKYKFQFNPKNCNRIYFNELFLLLNSVLPEKERFKRIKKKEISKLNIKCENVFNSCKPDEFFFENKKQIILGRFFDSIGCFYSCKGHYFSMAMEPYSLFKNDVFIRYIIDKPEIYINNSKKIRIAYISPDFRSHPVLYLTEKIYGDNCCVKPITHRAFLKVSGSDEAKNYSVPRFHGILHSTLIKTVAA